MWAVTVALAVLMWMWGAVCLHAVRHFGGGLQAPVRLAYLAVALALGAVVLALLSSLLLPASVLSRGWTQEMLRSTQDHVLAALVLAGGAAFLRGRARLHVLADVADRSGLGRK
jgi:hypothetical protein